MPHSQILYANVSCANGNDFWDKLIILDIHTYVREVFTFHLSFHIGLFFNKTSFNIHKMKRGHAKEMMCSLTLGIARGCSCLLSRCLGSISSLSLSPVSPVQTRVLSAVSVSLLSLLSACISLDIRAAMHRKALLKQVTGQRFDIEQF